MLWYSLEAPRRGASNEFQQHIFFMEKWEKITTFQLKKKSNEYPQISFFVVK